MNLLREEGKETREGPDRPALRRSCRQAPGSNSPDLDLVPLNSGDHSGVLQCTSPHPLASNGKASHPLGAEEFTPNFSNGHMPHDSTEEINTV